MNQHDYTYSYTIKFYQKEGRFRILLDNVHCERSMCGGNEWPLVQPTEDYSKKIGQVPTKKLKPMMIELKSNLQTIVDEYLAYIKKATTKDDDW